MKNLFKNLMLVAVAAMAFTACQNDNDFAGNAAGEGATTISVVANLDDTRSAFTGEKGDTGYQSVWNGGEAVKAYVVSAGGYADFYNVAASNEAVVEAEDGATQARFNLSFNSSLSNGALYIIAAADASVIDFEGSGYNFNGGPKPKITLPTEQTPGDNSVDPKAHILIYENNNFRASQSTDLVATFSHYAAYGKLSLKNFNAEGVTSYVLNINNKMYIINSAKTENVWFACEPAEVANMTISVNAADGTYTKKIVEGSNPSLEFVKGQVSTFTVNMEGVTTGEAVDTFNPTYRLESLSWNNSGYFDFITNYVGDGTNHTMNTTMRLRIYMHADDRPNNNSLKLGNYTCAGVDRVTPSSAGAVNMYYNADTYWGYYDYAKTSSTLSVSAENGEYVIVATINGQTWGYKGLPEGWPAPVESGDDNGDEPENPGEGGGNEPENPGEGGETIDLTSAKFYCAYNATLSTVTFNDYKLSFDIIWKSGEGPSSTGWTTDYTFDMTGTGAQCTINNVQIDGVAATSFTGVITASYSSSWYLTLEFKNVVIDGVTYTGSPKLYW